LLADAVPADEEIVATVYEHWRNGIPRAVAMGPAAALRLLTLKHIRNWSYQELEREVRANLVYRDFTRVGGAKMPDAKTMGVGARRSGRRCCGRFTSGSSK
jgi:IS5 family transposase